MKISALKTFCLTMVLMISTLLLPNLAFSYPLPQMMPLVAETGGTPSPAASPASGQTPSAQSGARQEARQNPQSTTNNPSGSTTNQTSGAATRGRSQPEKPKQKDSFGAFNRALYGS